MKSWKIGAKLLAILLACSLLPLIFIAVLSITTMRGLSLQSTRATTQLGTQTALDSSTALQAQAEEYLEKIAREQALKTDALLERIERELTAVAGYLTGLYSGAGGFAPVALPLPFETTDGVPSAKHMVAPGVESSPALEAEVGLLGNATYMVAPVYASNESMSNLYLGTPGGIVYRYSARNNYDESYDPRERPWYQLAAAANGAPVWTGTELDSYGILCATVAMAYYNDAGELLGVLASDVTLEQMQLDITSTRIGETGYAYLVQRDGAVIAHPYTQQDTGETTHQMPDVAAYKDGAGLFEAELEGVGCYVAYHQLPTTGWYFAVVSEVGEIVAPAVAMGQAVEEYLHLSQESISAALWRVLVQFVVLLAAAVLLILPVSFLMSRTITRPLKLLLHAAGQLGAGDLSYRAEVAGQDEVAQLAEAFNEMGERLRLHLEEVAALTAQRQRTETELAVAAKIQMGMLPAPLKQTGSAQLHAAMHPAREVGGDFYDYFLLDDNRLFVCIADVSGKGVPAALYMAKAKTLLAECLRQQDLGDAVQSANRQLAAGNEENMFVTAFLALLDLGTGQLSYCNAGHNTPLLQAGTAVQALPVHRGLALGCMPGAHYKVQQLALTPGDRLVLYTDGVTEAENPEGEFYGEQRLARLLEGCADRPAEALPQTVLQSVTGYANGTPQADDITLLVLEWL